MEFQFLSTKPWEWFSLSEQLWNSAPSFSHHFLAAVPSPNFRLLSAPLKSPEAEPRWFCIRKQWRRQSVRWRRWFKWKRRLNSLKPRKRFLIGFSGLFATSISKPSFVLPAVGFATRSFSLILSGILYVVVCLLKQFSGVLDIF